MEGVHEELSSARPLCHPVAGLGDGREHGDGEGDYGDAEEGEGGRRMVEWCGEVVVVVVVLWCCGYVVVMVVMVVMVLSGVEGEVGKASMGIRGSGG